MGSAARKRRRAGERAARTSRERPVVVVAEGAGWSPTEEVRPEGGKVAELEGLRRAVAAARRAAERKEAQVVAARRAGATWTELGAVLGVSAQAVQKRYGGSHAG